MDDATAQTHARRIVVLLSLLPGIGAGPAAAQQQADTTFRPVVANPAFAPGAGPVVLVDEEVLRHEF